MSAGRLDLTMERGATFDYALDLRNPDGTPVDLTGVTGRAEVRAGAVGIDGRVRDLGLLPILDITAVIGNPPGRVRLVVAAAVTRSALVAGANYCYDLRLDWPDGRRDRVTFGSVAVAEEITLP